MKPAGVVFAGGKASRFGSDKTRLPMQGRSLSSHLLLQMREAGLQALALAAPEAPPDLPEGVQVIPDQVPGLGPMGALVSVLEALQRPVLVAAGDMPALGSQAFRALLDAWKPGHGGLVTRHGSWEPLLAIYEPSLLPELRQALKRGQRGLYQFIQFKGLPAWDCPEPAWLANVNDPQDWARLNPDGGIL